MKNKIIVLFVTTMTSLISIAQEIDFSSYLDEIGSGVLSVGILENEKSIHQKDIGTEYCAFRLAKYETGELNIEFDFLGFNKPLPDKFNLNDAVLLNDSNNLKVLSSSVELSDKSNFCEPYEKSGPIHSKLYIHPDSLSIQWIQICQGGSQVLRYRELKCTLLDKFKN